MTPDTMTKAEKSCLLYLETCAVDQGGFAQGVRMNADDHEACKRFAALGLATVYRVPSRLIRKGLPGGSPYPWNHFVIMTDAGFSLAHELRKQRASRRGEYAVEVIAELTEMGKIDPAEAA